MTFDFLLVLFVFVFSLYLNRFACFGSCWAFIAQLRQLMLLSAHVKRFSVSRMQDFVVVVHNAAGSKKFLCQYFGNRFSLW